MNALKFLTKSNLLVACGMLTVGTMGLVLKQAYVLAGIWFAIWLVWTCVCTRAHDSLHDLIDATNKQETKIADYAMDILTMNNHEEFPLTQQEINLSEWMEKRRILNLIQTHRFINNTIIT